MKKSIAIIVIISIVAILATVASAQAQAVRFTKKVNLALSNSARYFGSEVDELNELVNSSIGLADKKVTKAKKSWMSDASRYGLKDTMVSIRDFSSDAKRTTLNVKAVEVYDEATRQAFTTPDGIFDVQRLFDACSRNGAEYGYEGRAFYACVRKDVGIVVADVAISDVTLTIHRVQQYWTVVNGTVVTLVEPADAWAIEMVKGKGKATNNGGNNGSNGGNNGGNSDNPVNEPDPQLDPVVDPVWDETPVDAHPSQPSTPANEPNPQLDVVVDPGWTSTYSSGSSGSFGSSGQSRPSSSTSTTSTTSTTTSSSSSGGSSNAPNPTLSEVVDPW